MNVTHEDVLRLRTGAVLAIAIVLAGVSLVLLTSRWHRAEDDAARRAVAARDAMRASLVRAHREQDELTRKIERFNRLAAAGRIGEERRLDWAERIRAIETARRLDPVRYEIAPRRPLDPALSAATGGHFEFLASSMRIEMRLLHEGDLIALLDDLQGSVTALVRPRACTIERLAWQGEPAGRATLKAQCTMDWITIREGAR